jgi:hypothetical protein
LEFEAPDFPANHANPIRISPFRDMNSFRQSFGLLLLGAVCLAGCGRAPLEKTHLTGLTKAEVRQQLGEPQKIEAIVKRDAHMFGPIEAIWDKVPVGEKIEAWTYAAKDGSKTLYFLPTSDKVAVEFYWFKDPKKNPVY